MIVTLWRSKKARNVSQTEVQLARQGEGNERFRPNMMSRSIVGLSIKIGEGFSAVLGKNATQWISGRFESKGTVAEGASFDLLRASVNLMTASIIISYATSLKLPLSTTYVTFMVAMGTSLADRAWGKESAVYRVAGVLQVLGGWVFTAITAFIMSGIFASILFYGGKAGLIIALLLAVFSLLRSNKLFKAVEAEVDALPTEAEDQAREALSQRFENHKEVVSDDLRNLDKLITLSLRSLVGSNKDILAETAKRLKSEQKKMEKSFSKLFAKHKEEGGEHIVEFTRLQVESHAKIEDLYRLTRNLVEECLDHVSNYGSMPRRSYLDFILQSEDEMKRYISDVRRQIRSNRPEDSGLLGDKSDGLKETFMNRLNHELDYMANGEVSLRLGKLQVKIILDLMGIVDLGEEVYRKHFDFYRTYVKE
jgi:gas vesicle protein